MSCNAKTPHVFLVIVNIPEKILKSGACSSALREVHKPFCTMEVSLCKITCGKVIVLGVGCYSTKDALIIKQYFEKCSKWDGESLQIDNLETWWTTKYSLKYKKFIYSLYADIDVVVVETYKNQNVVKVNVNPYKNLQPAEYKIAIKKLMLHELLTDRNTDDAYKFWKTLRDSIDDEGKLIKQKKILLAWCPVEKNPIKVERLKNVERQSKFHVIYETGNSNKDDEDLETWWLNCEARLVTFLEL